MVTGWRAWAVVGALVVLVPTGVTACGDADKAGDSKAQVDRKAASANATPPAQPFEFAITPAPGANNLPVSTEIGTHVKGGRVTSVTVTEAGGGAVIGQMRDDGSSWVPNAPLRHAQSYAVSVTATSAAGRAETRSTTFTTMSQPDRQTDTGLYLFDKQEYGVAMPVVVEFTPGIPKEHRAAVQRRLFVTTDPPQPGAWHWVSTGTQVYYRAPEYWRPGTTLTVRIALGGHPTGDGRYGDSDRRATAKIGEKLAMQIDNATKRLSVFKNDKLVKKMPVSLGKRSTPSSSGTMVIMDKQVQTVFDTFAELGPREGYRVNIAYAQRLTWGGEFIHSAPWSVGDQGRRNVSHGCVNLGPGNARWLFNETKVGDPVTVKGTEQAVEPGNGWTAWNMSWDEYVKGSALPVTTTGNAPVAETGPPAPRPTG